MSQHDCPCLIHRAHVCVIIDASPLNDGSSNELRHYTMFFGSYLHALKAMKYELSGPFLTSTFELKLDVDTMLEGKSQPSQH